MLYSMIMIGILQWMPKQQIEPIELVKQEMSMSINLLLKIPFKIG